MKRMWEVFLANVKVTYWCLRHFSRGCCIYREWQEGRATFVAATTGSIWNNTLEVQRIFYDKRASTKGGTQ